MSELDGGKRRAALVPVFNTQQLKDAQVLQLNTGADREPVIEALYETIGDNLAQARKASPAQVQHVLVTGPRGFGKSFTTRLMQIEVERLAQSGEPVAMVMLPEEQRNIFAPADFLREIARRLGGSPGASGVSSWGGDDPTSWQEAEAELDAVMEKRFDKGRGLIVLTLENFDILLNSVFDDEGDQQRLRAWMTKRHQRIMIFATSTGAVDQDYTKPIFLAFRRFTLQPWTQDDCLRYFDRLRASDGQPPLDSTQRAKAMAISDFIGGNPRLARLLGEVINTNEALTVAETLQALADELSDYYRRRIDDLSPRARKLLDALIRGGEPCSQSDLAKRVGTEQSRIAQAFSELIAEQIVAGRSAKGSRAKLYQVTDRVFVHFYKTRYLTDEPPRSLLATITEFLSKFYTEEEFAVITTRAALEGKLYDFMALMRARLSVDPDLINGSEYGFNEASEFGLGLIESAVEFFDKALLSIRQFGNADEALELAVKLMEELGALGGGVEADQLGAEFLSTEILSKAAWPFAMALPFVRLDWQPDQLRYFAKRYSHSQSSSSKNVTIAIASSLGVADYIESGRSTCVLEGCPPELRTAILRVYPPADAPSS